MSTSRLIQTIELHAGGALGRVLLNAFLEARGATMLEKFEYCQNHLDSLRRYVLQEPRGYPAMSSSLLLPPCSDKADVGFICLEQGGFTPMSGSNAICAVTAVLATGMVSTSGRTSAVVLDTPAGLVRATATVNEGRVVEVQLENVPSFVIASDVTIQVPEIGEVRADIAYGGQFYVLVAASDLAIPLDVSHSRELTDAGIRVLAAARDQMVVAHPERPSINEITWAMLYGPVTDDGVSTSCVVGPAGDVRIDQPSTWVGVLDRSPCGTGTSARMALLHSQGTLGLNDPLIHKNLLGAQFVGELHATTVVGSLPAVVGTIGGRAWITGYGSLVLDDEDPFPDGFVLGDIWSTASGEL